MESSMKLTVGDIVTVGRRCLSNPAGARAVVIEEYELAGRPGWSLLFENGAYDGFSPSDLELFEVAHVGHEPRLDGYEFTAATRLFQDYRRGLFSNVWQSDVAQA
jgi:hypothetical protein